MSLTRIFQRAASWSTVAVLTLSGLGALLPTTAHAAGAELRISEIHWAGTAASSGDQWIELVNTSASAITFSDATPYKLVIGTAPADVTYLLDSSFGTLPAGEVLLISKFSLAASSVHALVGAQYVVLPTLDLPSMTSEYRVFADDTSLVDGIIDLDGAGTGQPPFLGAAATVTTGAASMSRVNLALSGSDLASWYTAATVGAGFDVTAATQYGTPGSLNAEVAMPTGKVLPAGSTTTAFLPTVSGLSTADQVSIRFERVSYDQAPAPLVETYVASVVAGEYSVMANAPALPAGRYQITATAVDVDGNRSQAVRIPATLATAEYDYVVFPTSSTLASPTLSPLAPLTNQPTVTLTGSIDQTVPVAELEVVRNGKAYASFPVSGSSYSVPAILVPNMVNEFAVLAVGLDGVFSLPVMTSTLHDGLAPNAVDGTKVVLTPNTPGTADTIAGLAGAAEPGTTLYIYGDVAQTKLIATLTVAADGSFTNQNIGDNTYAAVYLVVQDAAGNLSSALGVNNPTTYTPTSGLSLTATAIYENQATVSWTKVDGVTRYRIKYKMVGASYGTPVDVCLTGNTNCNFSATIKDLFADTDYVFAIAAVDQYGNSSAYSELTFRTKQLVVAAAPVPPVVDVATPLVATAKAATKPTKVTLTDPTPSPTATPLEEGDVQSATTSSTSTNWTPWIVLAALIGLAVLATAGYFYWFGGEAGEAALASVMAERAREEAGGKSKKEPASPAKGKKDGRRW
jgi:hypothetical protein